MVLLTETYVRADKTMRREEAGESSTARFRFGRPGGERHERRDQQNPEKQSFHAQVLAMPRDVGTECSQQLIRIDIHHSGHIFGKGQLIQSLAHQPAQTHDRFATHQNVEPELSLQFFQWRRRRITQNEFWPERFFQSPRKRFRGKFRARLMSRTHCYQNRVLERREIAMLAKLEFLLEIAGEIVMPRELNGGTKRCVSLHKDFSRRLAAARAASDLCE